MEKTPEELVAASGHVLYEVKMLRATAGLIANDFAAGNQWVDNALIESFLVHARNLIQFLYPDGPFKTDVLAKHFFDEPERWESLAGDLPEGLKSVAQRANKLLAHITYDRIEMVGEKKKWDWSGIHDAIIARVDLFHSNARPELLGAWAKKG